MLIAIIRVFIKNNIRFFFIFVLFLFCETNMYSGVGYKHNENGKQHQVKIWTCAMHPQIRMNKPGKCPICGMKLIPLKEKHNNSSSNLTVSLSPNAVKLAEVQTSKVVRKRAYAELKLNGILDYDETSTANIVANFSGRVEALYANYTGMFVKKGVHLAAVFGGELYVDQREILIAHKSLITAEKENNPERKQELLQTYNSVMNKMRVLGFTKEQVEKIIKRGKLSDTVIIYAPISGTIIKKNIVQGQYFKKGDNLFIISDLKHLWLNLDAYEMDIPFLRYGQKVTFSINALPGKIFTGKIVFIDPIMNTKNRTSKVRVLVDNNDNMLKPEMFATGTVSVEIGDKGVIKAKSLKGKWISPMHPEIINDKPGNCPICGMKLVPAETMGFYTESSNNKLPLVIPSTAPLITGKRVIVYVELKPGMYEAREVVLGPKVGDLYIVNSGLKTEEKVVTNGNFMIDSELQIKSGNAGMISMFDDKNPDVQAKPMPMHDMKH